MCECFERTFYGKSNWGTGVDRKICLIVMGKHNCVVLDMEYPLHASIFTVIPKNEVVGVNKSILLCSFFDKQTCGAFCSRAAILQECKRQFNCTILYRIRIDLSSSKEV